MTNSKTATPSTPSRSPARRRVHSDVEQRDDSPVQHPAKDLASYVREYTREKPGVAALWCFGIGFVLGWKLKLW